MCFLLFCHRRCRCPTGLCSGLLSCFLLSLQLASVNRTRVAELWLNTSWCTTAAEPSRVSRDSSGCPAPSRVSTPLRLALPLSAPQRLWTWFSIRCWSLLLEAPSPPGCRASWETSLIRTWLNCQTEIPNITLMHTWSYTYVKRIKCVHCLNKNTPKSQQQTHLVSRHTFSCRRVQMSQEFKSEGI